MRESNHQDKETPTMDTCLHCFCKLCLGGVDVQFSDHEGLQGLQGDPVHGTLFVASALHHRTGERQQSTQTDIQYGELERTLFDYSMP